MLTAQPPQHDFVKTLSGTAATSDFRILRFFEFGERYGARFAVDKLMRMTTRKKNVKKALGVQQK